VPAGAGKSESKKGGKAPGSERKVKDEGAGVGKSTTATTVNREASPPSKKAGTDRPGSRSTSRRFSASQRHPGTSSPSGPPQTSSNRLPAPPPRMDQSGRPISSTTANDYPGSFRREPLMAEPISYLHLQARPTPEMRAGMNLGSSTASGSGAGVGSGGSLGQGQDSFGVGMTGYDSGMGLGSASSAYDRSLRHSAMDQAGPSGSTSTGAGSGWMPMMNGGGYGNGNGNSQQDTMTQGNGMGTDYMVDTGRSIGFPPPGAMSMDGYRGQMTNNNVDGLVHSGLPILPPPDNMAFMNHSHPSLLPIDVPSNQNRLVPLSSPHRPNFTNGPPLSFPLNNPESSTRMSSSSALPVPIVPTPVSMRSEEGSQTSEARRARSPILPTLNSKFPFLNANAGFRDGDSTHHRGSFSEKASPMITREVGPHDPSRQLPPLDQGSGSGSSNQKSAREKFSLRHMVEPVDEDPLEHSDREQESDHEDDVVGQKRVIKQGPSIFRYPDRHGPLMSFLFDRNCARRSAAAQETATGSRG
jgi:hypothetical protein